MEEALLALLGVLSSLLVQVIKKFSGISGMPAVIVAAIVSGIAGGLVAWSYDGLTGDYLKDIAVVFSLATLAYNFLLKSGILQPSNE